MPWKLVFFLLILAIVVFFAGFNTANVSDVSFGFYTIKGVPIFISLFVAFLSGALLSLPFVIGKKKIRVKKVPKEISAASVEDMPPVPETDDLPET